MTNIERKALELVNDVMAERNGNITNYFDAMTALCRAIERHEAFRQEVSDAVESLCDPVFVYEEYLDMRDMLRRRFIITKPDPLFDVLWALGMADDRAGIERLTKGINEELAKRGLEIREKE